ncbi:MAG: CBS domain-containing protein [Bacteroidia bacterium]
MKTVEEIMVKNPKACGKHDAIPKVVKEMADSGIGTLPVVDRDNKVIGIITDRDICLAIGKTNKHISDLKVFEAMTHQAHTCSPEDGPEKVFEIMRSNKVGRLPVIDENKKLKGIVSLKTVLRQLPNNPLTKNLSEAAKKDNIYYTLDAMAESNTIMSPYEYEHYGYNEHWGE